MNHDEIMVRGKEMLHLNEMITKYTETYVRPSLSDIMAFDIIKDMINESIETLYNGVAGVSEIDTVMKLGMAHPMGPLQLADLIGLDVCLSIMHVLEEGFNNPKYKVAALLQKMVADGKLGVKTGEGFYLYQAGSKELLVNPLFKKN